MEQIARQFLVFDRWVASALVGNGNINDTYQITVETEGRREDWLLQRLNHRVFKHPAQVMENIQKITEHLQHSDFPYQTTPPVATLNGQWLHQDEAGNYWRVFPFFHHTFAPENVPDADLARSAARAYGAFLSALRDFPVAELQETIPGFHDTDLRWQHFEEALAADVAGQKSKVAPQLEAVSDLKPVFDVVSKHKREGDLPLRATHNDTKAGNVLFDTRTLAPVAVIDLDTVMPGTILSDFGDMVRTFTPDRHEGFDGAVHCRRDILEAIHEGFLAETDSFLTTKERELLLLGGLWIVGEQALRFLTDHLAGDTYYKINYPGHNLVRAKNQLALAKELESIVGQGLPQQFPLWSAST